MKPLSLFAIVGVVVCALATPVGAEVKLPPVFSDHMVLQTGIPVAVFGTAAPGEEVAVELPAQKKSAVADGEGRWLVRLDPLPVGDPFDVKIAGKNTLLLKNVVAGEVWIAAGQSNMRYPLTNATNGKEDAAAANFPSIRFLRVGGRCAIRRPRPRSQPWRFTSRSRCTSSARFRSASSTTPSAARLARTS